MKDAFPFSKRLDEVYSVLSTTELRDLQRFLDSPWLNRDKSLSALHQFLSVTGSPKVRYNKKAAWKSMFGKAAYYEKKFRYLVSDLLSTIDEFIYLQEIRRGKPNYLQSLHDYYSIREANQSKAALASKIINSGSSGNGPLSPDHYLREHFANEMIADLSSGSIKEYSKYLEKQDAHVVSGLDVYYLIEKLRQLCITANDNNVLGRKSKTFEQTETLRKAQLPAFKDNIFVQAYLSVYYMLTKKTDEHYFKLKDLIDKHGYDFDDKNMAELFTYARNFCIGKINVGKSAFFNELFDLYQQGLKKRALLLNGEINEQNFKNIVTTALRTKNYDWALDFINEYRYKLNKRVRDNAYNYNIANYFFHTKQYDKALQNLQKVELNDFFYGLDTRNLVIKSLFELDEKEAFLNAYYSFRVFVMRKKNVSETHRRNYLHFLRIAKKLINLNPRNKKAIEKLKAEVDGLKGLADKVWIEAKLDEYS